MSAAKRLKQELKCLENNSPDGIKASLLNDRNFMSWEMIITCPPGSYYEGGEFIAHLEFPEDYPLNPPTMRFQTDIFHPNIYPDPSKGAVCISILHPPGDDPFGFEKASERWNPLLNIESIGLSVLSMLSDPNPNSPANPEAAIMFRENKKQFLIKAKDCAVKSKAEAERKRLKIKAEAEQKRLKCKAEDDRRKLMQEQSENYEAGKAIDNEKEAKTKAEEVKNKERESEDIKKEKSKIKGDGVKDEERAIGGKGICESIDNKEEEAKIKDDWGKSEEAENGEKGKSNGEEDMKNTDANLIDEDDGLKKNVGTGKEASIEAEIRAARERAVVPLDVRMSRFRKLLDEKQISLFSTWEKELHKIELDPRYLPLTSIERKQVFDKYVKERAEEHKEKDKKDGFKSLMEEALVNGKTSYSDFSREHDKDERYKAIEKSKERESQFNEFQIEVGKKEKEKRKQIKKDFKLLLKETEKIDRHAYWGDVKKLIREDYRYKAVESSTQKEDWFMDYVHELKDEHRREKEKKKERKEREKSRERSRSRSRRRSRSRSRAARKRSASRSRSRDKKKEKKEKRDRSRDRDVKEKKKKDKDRNRSRGRSRSRERSSKDKKKHKKDKKRREGLEDGDISAKDGEAEEIRPSVEKVREKRNGDDHEHEKIEVEDDHKNDENDNQKKEKEEQMLASLRKREEKVKMDMKGHLRDGDKERVQHQHQEAANGFSALLTDLIREPDLSWKEAKKLLKKNSRWEFASNLNKSEKEQLFDEHINKLIVKKENFCSLLDECNDIGLDSSFKEVKKKICDDPRYAKFSSSDMKCEKEFKEWLKHKVSGARSNFRQLLQEIKIISHKSLQMIKDKEGNHMEEIEEILSKDSRYLVMEPINEDRSNFLMAYLEELEGRGPPSLPWRANLAEENKNN